jgi:hypothetical protein
MAWTEKPSLLAAQGLLQGCQWQQQTSINLILFEDASAQHNKQTH